MRNYEEEEDDDQEEDADQEEGNDLEEDNDQKKYEQSDAYKEDEEQGATVPTFLVDDIFRFVRIRGRFQRERLQ